MLEKLSSGDRMRLMQFVCSFARQRHDVAVLPSRVRQPNHARGGCVQDGTFGGTNQFWKGIGDIGRGHADRGQW